MPRNIILTGVSRGLGRAMLDGFAQEGHAVFGCATNAEVVEQLKGKFPEPHQFEVVDVSDFEQVSAWSNKIATSGVVPDLIVNNAAVINTSQVLWEISPQDFDALMKINVTGSFHVIKAFLPAMMNAGSGVIVNFSSGWGRSTSPEVVPYCASKWAIEGLSRGLAQELPRGLATVAFNPGVIHTDMLDSCFGGMASSYPSPEQWAARAVPFLLGLDASDNGRSLDVPA